MAKPLSDHAEGVLRSISRRPLAAQEVNAGVSHKLLRQGYAEIEHHPSPYKTHKGAKIPHYVATEKGRRYLEDGI